MMPIQQNAGFIYFLTNPSMPGFVKIGCSRHPYRRAEELGASSGVPTPFCLEFFQFVLDMQFVEQTLHRMLSRYRVTRDREFFRIELSQAVDLFSDWISHAQLVPIEGQDYVVQGDAVEPLHLGSIPLIGKVDPNLEPKIRFILTRGGHEGVWEDHVQRHQQALRPLLRFSEGMGGAQ